MGSKTAEIDSRAIERAIWNALPRVELFCWFFIDGYLLVFGYWAMFVICHLFPEIRDEVPENFHEDRIFNPRHEASAFAQGSGRTRRRDRPLILRVRASCGESAIAPSQRVDRSAKCATKKHGVRICRTPCLRTFKLSL